MIKYSLICDKEHAFEGWFSSSQDFDAQKHRNLVTCPYCDSPKINKKLMAPSISTSKAKSPKIVDGDNNQANEIVAGTDGQVPVAYSDMMNKMRDLRNHIQANSEDVGNKFTDEARKIHYGEAEKRGIYGQASASDVKELVEEGVEVMALPVLPEDRN